MGKRATSTTSSIRVLIADDYPFFRRGLRTFIEEQPDFDVVRDAGSVDELLQLCEELSPGIVLLDLNLARSDGVVLIGTLRQRFPDVRLIVFMTPDDEEALAGCIASGVRGCIMKNADPAVVLNAVRAVSAGKCWLQPEMTGRVFTELRRVVQAERERVQASLTNRENEVLKLVAEGLRNSDIARRLFISERTVKIHVANIFSKLQVHDRVQATRYAIRSGMVPA
jgi:DNA-binding NarL/FixJ family response regulator